MGNEQFDMEASWKNFGKDVVESLTDLLRDTVEGAADDLKTFGEAIVSDTLKAAQLPPEQRDPLLAELLGQIKTVAEINRIRAVNNAWDRVNTIVNAAMRLMVSTAINFKPI